MSKASSPRPLGIKLIVGKYLFDVVIATIFGGRLVWATFHGGLASSRILSLFTSPLSPSLSFDALSLILSPIAYVGMHVFQNIIPPGFWAGSVNVLCMFFFGFLSFGLWHRSKLARRLAIAAECSGLLTYAYLCWAWSSVGSRMFLSPEFLFQSVGTILSIWIIWFLIKHKSAFIKPPPAPQG